MNRLLKRWETRVPFSPFQGAYHLFALPEGFQPPAWLQGVPDHDYDATDNSLSFD